MSGHIIIPLMKRRYTHHAHLLTKRAITDEGGAECGVGGHVTDRVGQREIAVRGQRPRGRGDAHCSWAVMALAVIV
jgi:hypothetical protein